jgi:hypothetical protein
MNLNLLRNLHGALILVVIGTRTEKTTKVLWICSICGLKVTKFCALLSKP